MRQNVRSIDTLYRGCYFRSRLEARWAVFFDALGIDWEYEPEGFVLSDGTSYLPDFRLPTFSGGMWCEVKPKGGDFEKAEMFARDAEVAVWLCEGLPDLRVYTVLNMGDGVPNYDQAYGDNRMFWEPGFEGRIPDDMISVDNYCDKLLISAVQAAVTARFEHGVTIEQMRSA